MNVFYEEDGAYKAAAVMSEQGGALHIETPHGKRAKIKAQHVMLRFESPAAGEFMTQAQQQAEAIDLDFLWQCCGAEEFGFEALGREYYGRAPEPAEAAALLLKLHAAPMYFYRKGRGHYRAATPETLKAALAGVEKRRAQEAQKEAWAAELLAGRLPEAWRPRLWPLLFAPDKSGLEWKALESAAAQAHLTPPRLFERAGALSSAAEYHLQRFVFEHFPAGADFPPLPAPGMPGDLPEAETPAFSIDDATTTEIDDAFSVAPLPGGGTRYGIHIAAPALGLPPGSALDGAARARLSTVYHPGAKITMLPQDAVAAYSLDAGARRPALSLYVETDAAGAIINTWSRAERVMIDANLRSGDLEPLYTVEALAAGNIAHSHAAELSALWRLACTLEAARGAKPEAEARTEYSFYVDDGRVRIVPRARGAPIDKIVAELMIHANSTWGAQLAAAGMPALYRAQAGGVARMTTETAPHQGLGVAHYAWSSSPLRRYADLANQRQLLALLKQETGPHDDAALTALGREFEAAHEAYGAFQRDMERHWCLRWLEQEGVTRAGGSVIRDALVRLDDIPLVLRVIGLRGAPGEAVQLDISRIDLWELTAHAEPVV